MLLAACGSAGSDTAMDPPVHNDPVVNRYIDTLKDPMDSALWVPGEPDTLITFSSSSHRTYETVYDDWDCSGLICNFNDSDFDYTEILYIDEDETAFNSNGLVNGPSKRLSGTYEAYDYWMSDSMFSLVSEAVNNQEYIHQAVVLGNNTGSRPSGIATYSGRTVAAQAGRDGYSVDIYHGIFNGVYNFRDSTIGVLISFPDIRVNASFEKVPVSSNGSFSVGNQGSRKLLDGAFFGRNHNEVAGTYILRDYRLVGSFGGIKRN